MKGFWRGDVFHMVLNLTDFTVMALTLNTQRWSMPQSQPGSSLRSRPKELWESPLPFLALPSSSSHRILPVSMKVP